MMAVGILICSIDKDGILQRCLDSLTSKTVGIDYKIYLCVPPSVVDNIQQDDVFFVSRGEDEPYSYSKFANRLVKWCLESTICLLNDDIEVVTPEWLAMLVQYAELPVMGVITPKLLFPDGTIQHVGCTMDPEGVCYHLHHHEPDDPGATWNQTTFYNTVSGACSVMRKAVFNEVGGYEEQLVSYNDIDFALKVRMAGYVNACVPQVVMIHNESYTRGAEAEALPKDKEFMKNKWAEMLATESLNA